MFLDEWEICYDVTQFDRFEWFFILVEAATGTACNFVKKGTLVQMFSCEFCEILRTSYLQNTSGWLLLYKVDLIMTKTPSKSPCSQDVFRAHQKGAWTWFGLRAEKDWLSHGTSKDRQWGRAVKTQIEFLLTGIHQASEILRVFFWEMQA